MKGVRTLRFSVFWEQPEGQPVCSFVSRRMSGETRSWRGGEEPDHVPALRLE